MKPVDQGILYVKDESRGDCMRACVASILELDPKDVPHFAEDWPRSWFAWERARSLFLMTHDKAPAGYSIANGDGPRGVKHSVIHLDGKMVHDPHPSRAGLLSVEWWYTIEPEPAPEESK